MSYKFQKFIIYSFCFTTVKEIHCDMYKMITCVTKTDNTNCSNITFRLSKIEAIRQNKIPQMSEVLSIDRAKIYGRIVPHPLVAMYM